MDELVTRLRFYNKKGELKFLVVDNEVKQVMSKSPEIVIMDDNADCTLITDKISREDAKRYPPHQMET
jgi:hypothetical protein